MTKAGMKAGKRLPAFTAFAAFALLVSTSSILPHNRSESYSSWLIDGESISTTISVPRLQATRIAPKPDVDIATRLASYLVQHTALKTEAATCKQLAAHILSASDAYLRTEIAFSCPTYQRLELHFKAFFPLIASHVHFAKVRTQGDLSDEHILRRDKQSALLLDNLPKKEASSFIHYFLLGIEHIASGLDHLAFLAAILLLVLGWRAALLAITGFTVGHSLSLALAVTGFVEPHSATIEALIGFTIALVAVEYVIRQSEGLAAARLVGLGVLLLAALTIFSSVSVATLLGMALFSTAYLELSTRWQDRPWFLPGITGAFGIIHGFGFAGFLLEVGLPPGRLVQALLGFNLGVEAGQILIVAGVGGLFVAAARYVKQLKSETAAAYTAATLAAMGTYWFVSRLFA